MSTSTSASNNPSGGTFKGSVRAVYAKEVMLAAEPVLKFYQFAQKKTELTGAGNSIKMLRINNIARGVRLGEIDNTGGYPGTMPASSSIPMNAMTGNEIEVYVYEYGNGIRVSEYMLKSSFLEIMDNSATLLGRDYARVVDDVLRDIVLASPGTVVFGDSIYANAAALAASSSTAQNGEVGLNTLREAHEKLATNKAQAFTDASGDYYVGIFTPHQIRSLREAPNFLDVTKYTTPEIALKGEVGKIEKIRIIETTALPVQEVLNSNWAASGAVTYNAAFDSLYFSDAACTTAVTEAYFTGGTAGDKVYLPIRVDGEVYSSIQIGNRATTGASVGITASQTAANHSSVGRVYTGVIFGANSYLFAEGLPVELRDGGVKEHGRVHEIVWYSIFGAMVANSDSIVKIVSL